MSPKRLKVHKQAIKRVRRRCMVESINYGLHQLEWWIYHTDCENSFRMCLLVSIQYSSSRMRVMSRNWSATKQRLHPQSVAEISRHSVLSRDGIRQCETSSGYNTRYSIQYTNVTDGWTDTARRHRPCYSVARQNPPPSAASQRRHTSR